MQYAQDFVTGETHTLGSHLVTAEEIIDFAQKYDPQGYHLSEEAGRLSCFDGLIASGWHTASIWMKLYVTAMLGDAAVQGSPGVDELRWLSPVRPGDVLNGRVEILHKTPSKTQPDITTVHKKGALTRDGESKPVCTLILLCRLINRPA